MTKRELYSEISKRTFLTIPQVQDVFDAYVEIVTDWTPTQKVPIPGIGAITTKQIPGRKGVMHMGKGAGKTYDIPPSVKPVFIVSQNFKDCLNGKGFE